jgi:ABC-type sugar transport system ATPase subunit
LKPNQAIRAGFSVIYQERQLIPSLSVMENVSWAPAIKGDSSIQTATVDTQEIIDSSACRSTEALVMTLSIGTSRWGVMRVQAGLQGHRIRRADGADDDTGS